MSILCGRCGTVNYHPGLKLINFKKIRGGKDFRGKGFAVQRLNKQKFCPASVYTHVYIYIYTYTRSICCVYKCFCRAEIQSWNNIQGKPFLCIIFKSTYMLRCSIIHKKLPPLGTSSWKPLIRFDPFLFVQLTARAVCDELAQRIWNRCRLRRSYGTMMS